MTEVIITSVAERDFAESLCWYAEKDLEVANDFDREFQRVVSELRVDPARFPLYDDPYRFILLRRFPFRVIFRIDDNDVIVMAVTHGSRSPDYWRERDE